MPKDTWATARRKKKRFGGDLLFGQQSREIARLENSDVVLWFGKHQGTKLSALPRSYVEWIVEQFEYGCKSWRMRAVVKNLKRRLALGRYS